MSSNETMAYSREVADTVRGEMLHLLDEHWSLHQHCFQGASDSVVALFEMLSARLPNNAGSALSDALVQWSRTLQEQYQLLREAVEQYDTSVSDLLSTDAANASGFRDT